MSPAQQKIHASLETKASYGQAAAEGAALRGELGTDAQLIAMAAKAAELRAAGDEAGYQALRAAAIKIHNSR